MAEGNGAFYNNFKEQVLLGGFNLGNGGDTIKMILVESHSPDIDTHAQYSDVSGDEFGDSSYSAQTLSSQAVTQDNTNDLAKWDAADVTFSSLDGGTPSHCILYDDTHASDLLICYWELGRAANGGDYGIQFHADGIATLS